MYPPGVSLLEHARKAGELEEYLHHTVHWCSQPLFLLQTRAVSQPGADNLLLKIIIQPWLAPALFETQGKVYFHK